MATVKAKSHYHGSDGYRFPGQEWEASDEEAKGLVEAGSVELVEKKKEEKAPVETKEDKTILTTKATGNPAVVPGPTAPAPPTPPAAPEKPEEKK